MLKAKFLCTVGDDDITAILPINESAKLIVSKRSGDVLVYTRDGKTLKLFQTYHQLLQNSGEGPIINALFYSSGLSTVFAQCERSIVLLNSSNLNQFDKIVDKRGIRQCWILEKPMKNESSKTVLIYVPNKVSKLKMFIWKGHSFKTVQETTLTTKDESVTSVQMGSHGIFLSTNVGIYYWKLTDYSMTRIDKIVAPVWPHDLHNALKEIEEYGCHCHDSSDARSTANHSTITRKTSFASFFQRHGSNHNSDKIRFIFQPTDRQSPVLIDGKTQKLFEVSVTKPQMSHLTAYNHSDFAQLNGEFDKIQFLFTRFLLLSNANSYRIVDYLHGFNYLDVTIHEGIKEIIGTSGAYIFVWTLKDNIELYKIFVKDVSDVTLAENDSVEIEDLEVTGSLKKMIFGEAILSPHNEFAICENNNCDDIEELLDLQALRLRDLSVLWCLKCFERCQEWFGRQTKEQRWGVRCTRLQELIIKQIFDKFIKFLAPPELVLAHCFPLNVIKVIDDATDSNYCFNKDENVQSIPSKYINKWCLPYLTDIRRNLGNLAREKSIIWTLDDREITVGIEFFQVDQHKELDVDLLLTIIDTALFKLYLDYNPSMVGPFTRVDNMCDFDTVVSELSEHQMIQELVDFYYHKQKHSLALKLLTQLGQRMDNAVLSEEIESNIKMLIIDYLSKLPGKFLATIFEYTKWLLEKFPEQKDVIISSIFINQTTNCSNFDFFEVYEFIDSIDKMLSLGYLEFVIDCFQSQDKKLYMILIKRYLECLTDSSAKKKLHAVLKTTTFYEPRTVSRLLSDAEEKSQKSSEESQFIKVLQVYPLKRLGEHDKALHILFDELKNYTLSSSYCNDVYLENQSVGISLLMQLFEKVLQRAAYENTQNIISFLQEHGSKVDAIEILSKLPEQLLLKDLKQNLSHRLETLSVEKNSLRIKRNLLQVELVNKSYQLNCKVSEYTTIGEERKCFVCHKVLKSNPSDVYLLFDINQKGAVTHYNCGKTFQEIRKQNQSQTHPKTAGDFLKST